MDLKSKVLRLSFDEIKSIREASAQNFHIQEWSLALCGKRLLWKWFKEGDVNSKYFHHYVVNIREINDITCIETQDEKLKDVHEVKQEIVEHFLELFRDDMVNKSVLRDFEFKKINME